MPGRWQSYLDDDDDYYYDSDNDNYNTTNVGRHPPTNQSGSSRRQTQRHADVNASRPPPRPNQQQHRQRTTTTTTTTSSRTQNPFLVAPARPSWVAEDGDDDEEGVAPSPYLYQQERRGREDDGNDRDNGYSHHVSLDEFLPTQFHRAGAVERGGGERWGGMGVVLPPRGEGGECQMLLATGMCEYGAGCRYSHDIPTLQQIFPNAPLFNDPVVICAYHDNSTANAPPSSSSARGGGRGGAQPIPSSPSAEAAASSSSTAHSSTIRAAQPTHSSAASTPPPASSSSGRGRGRGVGRQLGGRPTADAIFRSQPGARMISPGIYEFTHHQQSPSPFSSPIVVSGPSPFHAVGDATNANAHRSRGGGGGGAYSSVSSSMRTANPWMGAGAPRRATRGAHHQHFDPYGSRGRGRGGGGGRGRGGDQFEGGMDLDNMSYEEILELQETHGGDVPTPLPTNVLQSFPPVQYGTPAYFREVKAVLSAMKALQPRKEATSTTTTTRKQPSQPTSSSSQQPAGSRPSTAIEIYEDGDVVDSANTTIQGCPSMVAANGSRGRGGEVGALSPHRPQECLICCTLVSKHPDDDDDDDDSAVVVTATSSSSRPARRPPLVRILLCGHEFHSDCILEWFARKRTCPICKQDLSLLYNQMFNLGSEGSGRS